jgi:hypothetical protein
LHRANIAHKECEWKDGDRGGLAEWEETERKKKEKVCLDINRPSHGRSWLQVSRGNKHRMQSSGPDDKNLVRQGSLVAELDLNVAEARTSHQRRGIVRKVKVKIVFRHCVILHGLF